MNEKMRYNSTFDLLLKVDKKTVVTDAWTMYLFTRDRLYFIVWSDMNECYHVVCHDPTAWLLDDECSYETWYPDTEEGVIRAINLDLEKHGYDERVEVIA